MSKKHNGAYSGERKKWAIAHSPVPNVHVFVSGIVVVIGETKKQICYITFSEDFVLAIGKAMPCGVSYHDRVYIEAFYLPSRKIWQISATYAPKSTHKGISRLLWETHNKPKWIKIECKYGSESKKD